MENQGKTYEFLPGRRGRLQFKRRGSDRRKKISEPGQPSGGKRNVLKKNS